MGTASMYKGYSNGNTQRNPLIPPDFEDEDNPNTNDNTNESDGDEENDTKANRNEQDVDWSNAKNYMSKISSGNSKNIGRALSRYIKAHGGSKSISRSSSGGVITIIGLGNFIKDASNQGFQETLDNYKIDYHNKSTKEVLNDLINIIAPPPNTKEDSIARKALILTMEILYDLLEKEEVDMDSIDKLDASTLNIIIPVYIENYIYQKLINDLGSRIETSSKTSSDAVRIEKDLKEYIHSKVEIAFKERDITNYEFSRQAITSLFNQCYTVMEDLL